MHNKMFTKANRSQMFRKEHTKLALFPIISVLAVPAHLYAKIITFILP